MAYGGKYLRQLGAWAFEYGTQTSADVLNESALPDPQSVASLLSGNGGGAVASGGKPYLSTLTQPELEKIGLKAVEAGANPLALQSAFVTAQVRRFFSKNSKYFSTYLEVQYQFHPGICVHLWFHLKLE